MLGPRNAQQTWNQTGQDWRRDRPSSSQDWRRDWQWEGDRDRTFKGSSASNTARRSQRTGPEYESWGLGSDSMWHQEGCRPSGCPVAQAQANQGSLLAPVHSLDRISSGTPSPSKNQAPPQPKRKVVEKWSLFEAFGEKATPSQPGGRHRPPQRLPRKRRFQKVPH